MTLETIYFPVATSISFAHSGLRRIAARSLHPFKIEKVGAYTVNLTAPDGTFAYGVWKDTFERLPAGYTWVKFKENTSLGTAIRDGQLGWKWQRGTVEFSSDKFYAIRIESIEVDQCHITTKDGKTCPYVACRYFDKFSEVSKAPRSKAILEAFPAPVPGLQREHDPGVWDAPTEHNSIPVRYDDHLFSRFTHPTVKPVAALRLELDADKNPLYRCSYFGPAPK